MKSNPAGLLSVQGHIITDSNLRETLGTDV
jgi:hypothetical protein